MSHVTLLFDVMWYVIFKPNRKPPRPVVSNCSINSAYHVQSLSHGYGKFFFSHQFDHEA